MTRLFAFLALLPVTAAFADTAPPEWRLPNQGRGCVFQQAFHEEAKVPCGLAAYQRWTCPDSDWLLVGKIISDVGRGCSPAFVSDAAIRQAKPEETR